MANDTANQHINFIGAKPFSYQNICKTMFGSNDGLYEWPTLGCPFKAVKAVEAASMLIA